MNVGVVLPTYNGAEFIEESIESVLDQTYDAFELVVVDDASSDGTPELVREFDDDRITLVENGTNRGPGGSRNRGVERVDGELLAFIDHDDVWHDQYLERHVCLHENSDVAVVYSDTRTVDETGRVIEVTRCPEPEASGEPLVKQLLYNGGEIINTMSCVTMKRNSWEATGGQDPSFRTSGDVDLYIRLALDGEFKRLPVPLVDKRSHEGNVADNYQRIYEDHSRILETAMSRFGFLDTPFERRKRARMAYRRATSALEAGESREAIAFGYESLGHQAEVRPFLVVLLGISNLLPGPFSPGSSIFRAYARSKEGGAKSELAICRR